MAEGAPRRRWPRAAFLAVLALALIALAFVFASTNRPQPIRFDFGLAVWRGEAVHALFAAVVVGLGLMFLLGLPADLRARTERRRLERRVAALEREAAAVRAKEPPRPAEPARSFEPPRPVHEPSVTPLNRGEEGVV